MNINISFSKQFQESCDLTKPLLYYVFVISESSDIAPFL